MTHEYDKSGSLDSAALQYWTIATFCFTIAAWQRCAKFRLIIIALHNVVFKVRSNYDCSVYSIALHYHYDSMQALCYILPHEHTALQHYVTLHLMRGGWGERLSYESDGDARPLA